MTNNKIDMFQFKQLLRLYSKGLSISNRLVLFRNTVRKYIGLFYAYQLTFEELADAFNLGLRKMSEASSVTSYAKLSWLQAWHIRDDTYSLALAKIINTQTQHSFSSYWGEGKTSSLYGKRFATGSYAQRTGNINPKYRSSPVVQFYTHISDQYGSFHTKVINVGKRRNFCIRWITIS